MDSDGIQSFKSFEDDNMFICSIGLKYLFMVRIGTPNFYSTTHDSRQIYLKIIKINFQ